MSTPLHPWRDTLEELGVMGLIPPPFESAVLEAAVSAPVAVPDLPASRPASPLREPAPRPVPQPVPQPFPLAAKPVVAAPEPFRPPEAGPLNPSLESLLACASLDALQECIQGCKACPLGEGRIRFVFGEGDPKAPMMFIGEGPGRDEDLQGRPFVGKAGELLDKMIQAIGLSRQQVYIANVVKCRPPDNRTPTPQEAQVCLKFLKRQIELIAPKVIVTLGATPLRELMGIQTGITQMRGQWQRLDMLGGIPVMPTFHPAYVLRQYTTDVRRAVWNDLLAAKAWLEKGDA